MFIPSTGQIIFYISQCEGNMYYLFFNLICCLHVILVSLTFLIVLTLLMSLERENWYEASRLPSSSVRGFEWSCVGLMWRWRQQPLNKCLCWGLIAPVLLGYDSASATYILRIHRTGGALKLPTVKANIIVQMPFGMRLFSLFINLL